MKNKGWTWLCHHRLLLEYCYDFEGRVRFIKKYKPLEEQPIRLAAFRFVKGKLPDKLAKAWADYRKAYAVYRKNKATYLEADAAYRQMNAALEECYPEILALFRKECPDTVWVNKTLVFD